MAKKGDKKGKRSQKKKQQPNGAQQPPPPQTPENPPPQTPEPPPPTPTPPKAKDTKIKRGIAAAVELPSVIVPFIAWLLVYLVSHFVTKYDASLFDGLQLDGVFMLIAGGATILFFIVVPVYRNRSQLTKPFAKAIVFGGAAVSLLICGAAVHFAADWGKPVAEGTIKATAGTGTINLPGTRYTLYLKGHFAEMDREQQKLADEEEKVAEAKKAGKEAKKVQRAGTYKLSGTYEMRLLTPETLDVIDNFPGKFEQERQRRRVSKRGRGYLDVIHTTKLFSLRVDSPGEYKMQLARIGGDLTENIEYAVYHDRQFPLIISLLGAIFIFIFGFIDYLIRPLRADSYFAPAIGIAFGFTAYFASTSVPGITFSAMGVSLIVGSIMGGGSGYVLYLLSTKPYVAIAKKYMWTLN
ncbi:MAG: hypothetical protein P9L99_09500 [Candidatus Lernaella stagnicola]|nr:hypothetical protein [Candidatus Lernaella stagnicola]